MFKHGFPPEWSTLKKLIWLVGSGIAGAASGIWKTVTGTLIHITDALASPVKELSVEIEPQQSGSGDPSPTNIRPIQGRTGTTVNVTGVNLWDEEWELGDINSTTGQKTADNNRFRSKNYIPVLPSTTYYCQTANYDVIKRMAFYDAYKTYLGTSPGWLVMPNGTITTPANAYYALFFVATPTYNNDISINYPSTDHDYHAYQGNTYSVTFPDTVYGGTLDAVNGTLTVNTRTIDLPNINWTYQSGGYFRSSVQTAYDEVKNGSAYCSMYKYTIGVSSEDKVIYWTSAGRLVIRDSSLGSSVSNLLAAIQDIQFVCVNPEPETYQLTPQQISTLAGENNIWTDVNGEITLEYLANA